MMPALNSSADATEGAEIEKPGVLQAGDLERLQALAKEMTEIAARAAEGAERMEAVARSIRESLKRAQFIAAERVAPLKQVTYGKRPTADSYGPKTVLLYIRQSQTGTTLDELQLLTGYSKSTIRTYIPILRAAGDIHPTELRAPSVDAGTQ